MTHPQAGPDASSTPVPGAGGVVFGPAGGVLLVRYRSGAWAFPKGHVETGETHEQTAVREVQEEGGVTARILAPLTATHYRNDRGVSREIHWFVMLTAETAPLLEDTFSEGGFFPPDTAAQMLSYPEDRHLLALALTRRSAQPAPTPPLPRP